MCLINLVKTDVSAANNVDPLSLLSPGCTIRELRNILTLLSTDDYLCRLTSGSLKNDKGRPCAEEWRGSVLRGKLKCP